MQVFRAMKGQQVWVRRVEHVVLRATWLNAVPFTQRAALTTLTYVVLAIIPLVSLLLAVVDMDLERSKLGGHGSVGTAGGGSFMGSRAQSFAPGAAAMNQSQPKYAPSQAVGGG